MDPRARKHLFANVAINTEDDLESWKKTFLGSSASPAHYTKTLSVHCPHVVTDADAEAGGWIQCFARVTHLEVSDEA